MATGTSKMDISVAKNITATGAQPSVSMFGYSVDDWSCQVTVIGTGAVTAVGSIDVSNDGLAWINDSNSQFNLSGTGSATMGFVSDKPWKFVRLNLTSISGTGAAVTATLAG